MKKVILYTREIFSIQKQVGDKRIELDNIIPSGVTEAQRDKCCVFYHSYEYYEL